MKMCLVLSWAPDWKEPNAAPVEMKITARAASVLYRIKRADMFLIVCNAKFKGMATSEWAMLYKLLIKCGIPKSAILLDPLADSTDGEIAAFKKIIRAYPPRMIESVLILSQRCKNGRIEKILRRLNFSAEIVWAESAVAVYLPKFQDVLSKWNKSWRSRWDRVVYGILPQLISPFITQFIASKIRH